MLYAAGLLLLILVIPIITGWSLSAPGYKGPKSDHFDGTKFHNPSGAAAGGFHKLIKWLSNRDNPDWRRTKHHVKTVVPRQNSENLSVTFINHSTFLIQCEFMNILTDPVYSERVSPFSFAGPKRVKPPGIRWEELPDIDCVLISHNHYDHLDIKTVKRLWQRFRPRFIVPLGVGEYLRRHGITALEELDWGTTVRIAHSFDVICVPAQHFSGRGLFDRDKTLWCGFVLKFTENKIYFAGDSGFDASLFSTIGEDHGPMDLSLIPIGAYRPEWFMSSIHMSPEEAFRVHQLVRSSNSIAMHYGTFPLADDRQGQPEAELIASAEDKNSNFFILPEGQRYLF